MVKSRLQAGKILGYIKESNLRIQIELNRIGKGTNQIFYSSLTIVPTEKKRGEIAKQHKFIEGSSNIAN